MPTPSPWPAGQVAPMARTSPKRLATGNAPTDGGAEPTVAPRWEWRTFSRKPLLDRVSAFALGTKESPSEETYVLSARSLSSVKIRDHRIEVKVLEQVSPDGLELWRPTLVAQFPLSARTLAALYDAWAIEMPRPNAPCWSTAQLMHQIVEPHRELFAISVVKRRTHFQLARCRGEHVDVNVNGEHWESLALDDADQAVVLEAVATLGMAMQPNTSFPSGLTRIVGGLTAV